MISQNSGTSISSASLQCVIDTLRSLNLNVDDLLRVANIDHSSGLQDRRIPQATFNNLIKKISQTAEGMMFGIKFAENIHATTYDSFGVLLVSSKNLRAFCQNSARYFSFANTGRKLVFDESQGLASLSYTVTDNVNRDERHNFVNASGWLATWLKLMRMASRPNYTPAKVTFRSVEPECANEIGHYVNCPVEWQSESDSMFFNLDLDFETLLPGGNAELARRSESLVFNQVRELGVIDPVNSVRIALFELLPKGDTSSKSIAEYLDIKESTLQLGLKKCGTNLTRAISDTRRELAEDYIPRVDLTINEVAYMLGFSDCSNFARSFRRWTGKSPTEYRQQFHKTFRH